MEREEKLVERGSKALALVLIIGAATALAVDRGAVCFASFSGLAALMFLGVLVATIRELVVMERARRRCVSARPPPPNGSPG